MILPIRYTPETEAHLMLLNNMKVCRIKKIIIGVPVTKQLLVIYNDRLLKQVNCEIVKVLALAVTIKASKQKELH